MGLRKILTTDEPALHKVCRPVEKFDWRLHKLLGDMRETLIEANGVGLAAPQVAVLRRVVVMDCGDGLIEMVNPEIVSTEGEQDGPEGCLSVPGRRGMVKRPMVVRARFQDRNGEWYEIEAEDLLAQYESGDKTEESFAVLAEEYSEDEGSNTNGGLYDAVAKGQMVEEFDAFCFAGHKKGDTAIVYGESSSYAGYHVMYYVGEGELYSDLIAENSLVSQAMNDWVSALVEGYEPSTGFWLRLVG